MFNGTRQRVLVYHVVMASRKPKGIVDDIYKGVTNIVSPWLGTPPGELKQVTQFKEATRVAAETLDQTFAGGMVKAGTQGNKALVKQAGVNAAALATGYVAGKITQKVLPLVQTKLGNEIGVHLSDTDKLRNIRFSPERAGTGNLPYSVDIEPGATYKFAPYRNVEYDVDAAGYEMRNPTEIVGRMNTQKFAGSVSSNNQQMSRITENPTKKFAYITKSKPGILDEDWQSTNAFTVDKQKVVQKVQLPQITVGNEGSQGDWLADADKNYNDVKKVLYDALKKREQITQANLQLTLNAVRGVTGVATQKTGNKLNNKNKRR
jgi:hypothetical protein